MVSGGAGLGRVFDETGFAYESRLGDFDVRVRVASLGLTDPWATAGLIARQSLDTGSLFAAAIATPSITGCFFQTRAAAGTSATQSGSYPVNYPNTWLRLRRSGDVFTAFAGLDGAHWTTLGSVILSLPPSILVGLSAASAADAQVTASFRDYSDVTTDLGPAVVRPETLGQSSRLTSLVISEIMSSSAARPDGKKLEFIELFNTLGTPEDLSGYRISGDVDFTFPSGTTIAAGGFPGCCPQPG